MKAATVYFLPVFVKPRISIHAAREGGDVSASNYDEFNIIFQSTPPVKAATCLPLCFLSNPAISIHAAREGGDSLQYGMRREYRISIHAAREGGDILTEDSQRLTMEFQSTPPVKAATE